MRKLIILVVAVLISGGLQAQNIQVVDQLTRHGQQFSKSLHVVAGAMDSVVVQFAGSVKKLTQVDTLITGGSVATYWDAAASMGDIMWNGYLRVQASIANTDLAVDSLEIKVYALDKDGTLVTNDVAWCNFGTPPTFSSAKVILAWTTALTYTADLTGAFGEGTGGLLIIIDPNDAAGGGETGVMTLDIVTR